MSYQSWPEGEGDSKSAQKLEALGLPEDLSGLSVLDLGCNEGFFSAEALKRGARRVMGIDSDSATIQKAQERNPGIDFRALSWWELPDEKFDLILFLSASHYEERQKDLFRHLASRMTDDGLLILEAGVSPKLSESWEVVKRHDGFFSYPSWDMLTNRILEDFAVRDIRPSAPQKGDPIPRWVFHCRIFQPTVIFIGGVSGSGKSVLAREFSKLGALTTNLDVAYNQFLTGLEIHQPDKVIDYLHTIWSSSISVNSPDCCRWICGGLLPDPLGSVSAERSVAHS